MKPAPQFSAMPASFWAHVKLVSEGLGYSGKAAKGAPKPLRRYTLPEVRALFEKLSLTGDHLAVIGPSGPFGQQLCDYLNLRSEALERQVAPALMNRDEARAEFERLRALHSPRCLLPMNKQKGEKRHNAYLAGIVNILTEEGLGTKPFNGNPLGLTTITRDGVPLRTLSRRMDGAYPDIVNPHAVWEVKEYYGTTTFGSRVADGVYETMLDGFELAELLEHEKRKVLHYLIVDDRFTWWDCGRSYLCRIVDMLHMGLVDEVLFGREVLTRWPAIVQAWP
ncbi:MAG TPA: hypothetical protein VK550_16050 [Polyangiaceae bacterium]|nr:hypothetical protein [Polyangiaceae bacterium]